MKKSLFSNVIVCLLLTVVFSCNKEMSSVLQDANSDTPARTSDTGVDTTYYSNMEKFLYNHIKLHLSTYDPYLLMPEKLRDGMKKSMDSLKAAQTRDVTLVWKQALANKVISTTQYDALQLFSKSLSQISSQGVAQEEMQGFFKDQFSVISNNKELNLSEKQFILEYETTLKAGFNAFYESLLQPATTKGGRVSSNCTALQISCYGQTISAFAGVGAIFSEGAGSIVGAIVGTVVSVITCTCDTYSCTYPTYISTPDVCYDSYHGIDFEIAGYGNAPSGFQWEVYSSDNMIPANLLVSRNGGNTINISNSDLQGNTAIYVRALTNCSGTLLTPPKLLQVNIPYLGVPSYTITGNMNPNISTMEGYNLVGRNMVNTVWNLYTHGTANGTFLSQNSTSAVVQWNSTAGYIYMTASCTSSCGSYVGGTNIYTHN